MENFKSTNYDKIEDITSDLSKLKIKNKVGYVYDKRMLLHDLEYHPECPERISSIYNNLKNKKLLEELVHIPSEVAKDEDLLFIHDDSHLKNIESLQFEIDEDEEDNLKKDSNGNFIKRKPDAKSEYRIPDTYDNAHTYEAAKLSAGSLIRALTEVHTKKVDSAFAIIRPPGHHAYANKACGFCFYNNVAVAIKYAQEKFGYKKIAVVDWDVHHGNGTQELFYNDPNLLFISLHRYDYGVFYPGGKDGDSSKVGKDKGEGFNLNIPWDCVYQISPIGDDEYHYAFEKLVLPVLSEYSPDLIFVSCGFDAAENDPLGGMNLTPLGYAYMVQALMKINNKIVIALEGGYNFESLAGGSEACIRSLMGQEMPFENFKHKLSNEQMEKAMRPTNYAIEKINALVKEFSKYWKSLNKIKLKILNPDYNKIIKQNSEKAMAEIRDLLKNNELVKEYFLSYDDYNKNFSKHILMKFTVGDLLYLDRTNEDKFLKKERIAFRTNVADNGFFFSGSTNYNYYKKFITVSKKSLDLFSNKDSYITWNKYDLAFDLAIQSKILNKTLFYETLENLKISKKEILKNLKSIIAFYENNLEKLNIDLINVDIIILVNDNNCMIKLANLKDYSISSNKIKPNLRKIFKEGIIKLLNEIESINFKNNYDVSEDTVD